MIGSTHQRKAPPVRAGLSWEANYRNVPSMIPAARPFNRAEDLALAQKNEGHSSGTLTVQKKAPPKEKLKRTVYLGAGSPSGHGSRRKVTPSQSGDVHSALKATVM